MEKFFRQPGKDPFINTPNDTTPALFGHINAIVENKYNDIILAF